MSKAQKKEKLLNIVTKYVPDEVKIYYTYWVDVFIS